MKTTIEIPDDLFHAAQAAAVLRGQTLKQLLTVAVQHELQGIRAGDEPGVDKASQSERKGSFRARLDALAQHNALAWESDKSALQQLQEDRDARRY